MSRKRSNIRPELIGELFTDGKNYFKLLACATEATVTIMDISGGEADTRPLSEFAHLVLMKPVRPIEKAKKPRADVGKKHNRKQTKEDEPIFDTTKVPRVGTDK